MQAQKKSQSAAYQAAVKPLKQFDWIQLLHNSRKVLRVGPFGGVI
jgi:hypothetical protein